MLSILTNVVIFKLQGACCDSQDQRSVELFSGQGWDTRLSGIICTVHIYCHHSPQADSLPVVDLCVSWMAFVSLVHAAADNCFGTELQFCKRMEMSRCARHEIIIYTLHFSWQCYAKVASQEGNLFSPHVCIPSFPDSHVSLHRYACLLLQMTRSQVSCVHYWVSGPDRQHPTLSFRRYSNEAGHTTSHLHVLIHNIA